MGNKYGIHVIPGVEISTETDTGENIHVLGYFPINMSEENNAALQNELSLIRDARYERGKEMLRLLAEKENIHLDVRPSLLLPSPDFSLRLSFLA